MDTLAWIVLAAAAGLVAAVLVLAWEQRHPWRVRAARRVMLDSRSLEEPERSGYLERWHDIEADFTEVPDLAVAEAHDLVHLVMLERGYPVAEEPDARPGVVSVEHPDLAEPYRRANQVHLAAKQGVVPTLHLEDAFGSYRSLFGELVSAGSRN